ncbi:MAG: histidinol-phosphate transaminase, partial [Anaerolineales bacterium]|nr:histidinol-phosphate transaminase [Anaerolineales bacterium]
LASNENALGPSPLAMAAAQQALAEAHRYPGLADRDLRRRLGPLSHPGFSEQQVIIGNGATDLIRLITQAFIFDGGQVITCSLTFPLYHICATMFGGTPLLVPPDANLGFDLPAMAAAIGAGTRLVFICTPNNPTGLICRQPEVEDFLHQVPEHVVVVFDESYRDFADDPALPDPVRYVAEGRNVIVIRSFSKSAGLANLRVGYAIARPELVEYLHRAQPPFNTGTPALVAAAASLDDHAYFERSRRLVRDELQWLYAALDALDVCYVRSQANFVLITNLPVDGRTLAERLTHRGIIVRPMGGWGLPTAIRVTVGAPEHNQRFAAALQAELSALNGRDHA